MAARPTGDPRRHRRRPLPRDSPLRRALWRSWCRWAWPPDKWQRLRTVADLIGPADAVLDVGGRGGELARLVAVPVTSANVEEPCDVLVPTDRLPWDDDAFDVVTSTDVLEHVRPDLREGHLAELLRVARRRVVICFPAGSDRKVEAELALQTALARLGVRMSFLDEHVELGLPTVEQVLDVVHRCAPRAGVRVRHELGVGDGDEVLVDAMRARHRRDVRALLRVGRAWVVRPSPELADRDAGDSNRAYVVVELDAARS